MLETMIDCSFCKIVSGEEPCHRIWEDEEHLAFLPIYPNTKGATVVIPKRHLSSYAFSQSDKDLSKLIVATKKVALMLDNGLDGVGRTVMFLEGYLSSHDCERPDDNELSDLAQLIRDSNA